ncbi:MAG: DUF1549 domain-containing protein [Planctomycetaceae bacterium]|nr:DUF1549 domain-containing protein [Planctomycetaceae bacterium]
MAATSSCSVRFSELSGAKRLSTGAVLLVVPLTAVLVAGALSGRNEADAAPPEQPAPSKRFARPNAPRPFDRDSRRGDSARKSDSSANTGKGAPTQRAVARHVSPSDSAGTAAAIDVVIREELAESKSSVAPVAADEDFLRRVTFDLTGTSPSPRDVTLFGLDSDPAKRAKLVDQLLDSDEFSRNWARYWRDVVFSRATEMRAQFATQTFEDWMHGEFQKKAPWDAIATSMLTAKGGVREEGSTGLIFAHGAEPAEVAAEVSRIFLGIQIQCANCHDHPTDAWKREQFHQLAAFFPRLRLQPKMTTPRTFEVVSLDSTPFGGRGGGNPLGALRENPELAIRRLDQNRDGKLSKSEAEDGPLGRLFDRLLGLGDTNKDGMLSAEELKKIEPPMMAGRGSREYHMPDLNNPSAPGKRIDPEFFVTHEKPGADLSDADRRAAVARYITSPDNPWFARAFVNRIWSEMLGEGFYIPVDDMGPEREPRYGKALDLLADGFVSNRYDVRWVYRTIASTEAYQRQIRPTEATENPTPFVAAVPTRLRSDQLYSAITKVLGIDDLGGGGMRRPGGGMGRGPRTPRDNFAQLFGFDPSTPHDEVVGSVPQALFLMNSPLLTNLMRAGGRTTLSGILTKYSSDRDALNELYLMVLAREPSEKELKICTDYIAEVNNRNEAFEDLLWSLLNSSEFLTKR